MPSMILLVISGFKMLLNYEQYNTIDDPEHSIVSKKFIIDYDIDDVVDGIDETIPEEPKEA